jgi:hypothetical protein
MQSFEENLKIFRFIAKFNLNKKSPRRQRR